MRVQYSKCAYGQYRKFNPIKNGVYILVEVSIWIPRIKFEIQRKVFEFQSLIFEIQRLKRGETEIFSWKCHKYASVVNMESNWKYVFWLSYSQK